MNRMSWLLVVPLALVSALSASAGCVEFDSYEFDPNGRGGAGSGTGGTGAGGVGGGTGGTGGMPECTTVDECPNNECRMGGSCNAGTCEWTTEVPAGDPVGTQVYGDCQEIQCNAAGVSGPVNDPADTYDFGDPCYLDGCNAWMTLMPDAGKQCTTKWGKADGLCDSTFNCIDCAQDADCGGTQKCTLNGKCVPAHCANGTIDSGNNETDVDCGGPCAPCAVGLKCSVRADCEGEGACTDSPKTCKAPTCGDGFKNGDETDLDCGGTCAADEMNPEKCGQGKGCLLPRDCAAGLSCKSGSCQP